MPEQSQHNADQWIQADLDDIKVVVKVATQGRADWEDQSEFVTSYSLATSTGGDFQDILGLNGDVRLFAGNINKTGVVENCLDPIQVRFIQLRPLTWNNAISLRWEIYALPDEGKCTCI